MKPLTCYKTEEILYSGCSVVFVPSRVAKQSLSIAVMSHVMVVLALKMVDVLLSAAYACSIDPHR